MKKKWITKSKYNHRCYGFSGAPKGGLEDYIGLPLPPPSSNYQGLVTQCTICPKLQEKICEIQKKSWEPPPNVPFLRSKPIEGGSIKS